MRESKVQIGNSGLAFKLQSGQADCHMPDYVFSGEEVLFGYRVIKQVSSSRDAEITHWDAPDLACHPLKLIFQGKFPDGTTKFITEQIAVAIQPGEPPADIFDVDKNYVEVAPSQLYMNTPNAKRACPGLAPCDVNDSNLPDVKEKLRKLDNAYKDNKWQ